VLAHADHDFILYLITYKLTYLVRAKGRV